MKRIILCICLFIFIRTEAQQINPVPDYVFSNKMSVGRNAVTDTAAYFSIGPRYGAIRGMMPPMVTDTASMSATKRNGLLIFSIQKNKYLYWDSVGSKWAEMAGTAGSAITGSGVAGYMPEFTTSTNLDTTRLYHSAGRFAIGSTTTTNGVFNVYGGQTYFDTSLKVGTQTLFADEGKNEVYVNTTSDAGAYALQVAGSIYNTTGAVFAASSGNVGIGTTSATDKLRVIGTIRGDVTRSETYSQFQYWYPNFSTMSTTNATPTNYGTVLNGSLYFRYFDVSQQTGIESVGYVLGVHDLNNDYGYSWQMLSDFSGNIALRAASTSTTWKSPYMIWKSDNEVLINTTSDAGAYALQVAGAIYNTTTITTGAPTGGSIKPWRLGEAATVSPTSPNRTIRVEIDGTVYYIHAKTTND